MIQNKPKIIGLTGGIATGKSTVSKLILNKGFPLIDADVIAREVVRIGEDAYNKIIEEFGKEILQSDKSIDRKKLGDLVFGNKELRLKLNSIVHPEIYKKIREKILLYSKFNDIIFLDIPLLIEGIKDLEKNNIMIDEIWLVYTEPEIQLNRLMKRDKIDRELAIKKINSQMSIKDKLKYAHVIIDNNSNIEELIENVDKALRKYM